MMHRLHIPGLIDPRFLAFMRGCEHIAMVRDSQSVTIGDQVLLLADPSEISLVPGTSVYVSMGRNFMLETDEERTIRNLETEARILAEEEAHRQRKNRLRVEAEAFNAALSVPVRWTSGMKDVLSGLSEKSMGNGANARTVTHIMLLEDMHQGRIQRKEGDFLCTSKSGNNGKQWGAQPEDHGYDGDGNKYALKVTCKQCLKMAQQWKKSGRS